MGKIRARDLKPAEPPATKADVVRLEALLSKQEPVDLTPLESHLREQTKEIKELREIASQGRASPSYVFEIERQKGLGLMPIERVIARPEGSTALTRGRLQ